MNSPLSISWNVTSANSTPGGTSAIAVTINDPNGNQVFSSITPPVYSYDSVGQEVVMPLGGAWFTGVTKIKLDQSAKAPSLQGLWYTIISKSIILLIFKLITIYIALFNNINF